MPRPFNCVPGKACPSLLYANTVPCLIKTFCHLSASFIDERVEPEIIAPLIYHPLMVAVEVILPVNSPPLAYTLPRNNASPVLALSSKVAFQLLYAKSPFLDMYTPE
jgi:hypothetical protein|nr:MAG TPA: hypothetical protein [Bacteriophage sp.]